MINFHLSRDDFEYDVRGLLMSFFPGEEFVKNQEENAAPEEKAELTIEIPEGEGEDRIAQKHSQKFSEESGKNNLAKTQDLCYTKDKVQVTGVPSGLCG